MVCDTLSGYPHENASKFLSQFKSYAQFLNLNDSMSQDSRKVAAFHLHLRGPAVSWFNTLTDKTWECVLTAFRTRFFLNSGENPSLFLEMENFSNLTLSAGQPIEDLHDNVMEKGIILGKPDNEILGKFISGLPDKLRLFVGAGAIKDIMTALTQDKLGEASGWRQTDYSRPVHVLAAVQKKEFEVDSHNTIKELSRQVEYLTKMVGQCMNTHAASHSQPSNDRTGSRRPHMQYFVYYILIYFEQCIGSDHF